MPVIISLQPLNLEQKCLDVNLNMFKGVPVFSILLGQYRSKSLKDLFYILLRGSDLLFQRHNCSR